MSEKFDPEQFPEITPKVNESPATGEVRKDAEYGYIQRVWEKGRKIRISGKVVVLARDVWIAMPTKDPNEEFPPRGEDTGN